MKYLTTILLSFFLLVLTAEAQEQEAFFTGAGQWVFVPYDAGLNQTTGLTLEAWILHDPSFGSATYRPSIIRRTSGNSQYELRVDKSTRRLEFRLSTTSQFYEVLFSTTSIPDLIWTHVAATYDGSFMRVYINGVAVGSLAKFGGITPNLGGIFIGGGSSSGQWYGKIDELRVWDLARSPTQLVESMYSQFDNQPGQVATWHFNSDFDDSTGGRICSTQGSVILAASTSPIADLRVLAPTVSSLGAPLNFTLRGAAANAPYFFDNSFAGSTFGMPLFAPLLGQFPLDAPLLNLTYGPAAPGVFVGYMGYTDAQGEASATFNVPPFPSLVGLDLHSAFLYLDNLSPMVLGGISPVTKTRIHDGSAPSISTIVPNQGPLAGGWPIAIIGQNFLPNATVLVRGQPATQVQVLNATLITCLSPPGLNNGSFNVDVINGDGNSATVINGYSYVNTLVVNSLSPTAAVTGQSVTIAGSGMGLTATVSVDGIPATITSASGMQLIFTMPAGASCHATVVVSKPDGQSGALVMNPGPFISSMTGDTGPYTGGTLCKIYGGFFSSQAQVSLEGNSAVVLLASPGYIEFLTPPGLPGPATITITNPDGCTASTSFSYGL